MSHTDSLNWLEAQHDAMVELVQSLSNTNSGTHHLAGVDRVRQILSEQWSSVAANQQEVELDRHEVIDQQGEIQQLELAKSLSIQTDRKATRRVFLCIHMDTVYPLDHPFQGCRFEGDDTLRGPGVADAKGGLVVLLYAIKALERSPLATNIDWEVFLNSDEEVGSPGSAKHLAERAPKFDFGLLFEPSLPDGSLVSQRKGSGNFSVIVRGRSAHAGREFKTGRNAITHLTQLINRIDELNGSDDMTINIGHIQGGGPVNVVPDLAIARLNTRVESKQRQVEFQQRLSELVNEFDKRDGFQCESHGKFYSPPKIPDDAMKSLQRQLESCSSELGDTISWRDTGGVCDGNKLAAAGLANIDTLGPCGGEIHSPNEFLLVDTLVPRAKLVALLLLRYAAGDFNI